MKFCTYVRSGENLCILLVWHMDDSKWLPSHNEAIMKCYRLHMCNMQMTDKKNVYCLIYPNTTGNQTFWIENGYFIISMLLQTALRDFLNTIYLTQSPQTQWPEKQKNIIWRRPWVNMVIPAGYLDWLGMHLKKAPAEPGEKDNCRLGENP